jgi:short chain dehydrogenase
VSLAQDLDFSGRRILITGAANGFGAAIANAFAEQRGSLVLADIEEGPLREIAGRLGAQAHVFDQSDPASVERLAQTAGAVDILVNNAHPGGQAAARDLARRDPALDRYRPRRRRATHATDRAWNGGAPARRHFIDGIADRICGRREPRSLRCGQGCDIAVDPGGGSRVGSPWRACRLSGARALADAHDAGDGAAPTTPATAVSGACRWVGGERPTRSPSWWSSSALMLRPMSPARR